MISVGAGEGQESSKTSSSLWISATMMGLKFFGGAGLGEVFIGGVRLRFRFNGLEAGDEREAREAGALEVRDELALLGWAMTVQEECIELRE